MSFLVPYQHAHIYLGNNLFLDAEPGGARIQHYEDLDAPNTFWSTDIIELTDNQREDIVKAAKGYVGGGLPPPQGSGVFPT